MKLLAGLVLGATLTTSAYQTAPTGAVLHDNEPPIEGIVGTRYADDPPNRLFRLAETPRPFGSLMLFADGRYLVQGLDYNVDSKGWVEITDAKVAPRHTLIAHYRATH